MSGAILRKMQMVRKKCRTVDTNIQNYSHIVNMTTCNSPRPL